MSLTFIKLDINILNDTKIKLIRKMPDGDSLLVLWIGILCLAMKSGTPGMVEIGDGIPFTEDALSIELDIPLNTVRLGLATFERYKMIEVLEDGGMLILKFNKHQEIDRIRDNAERSRIRSKRYRDKIKMLPAGESVPSRKRHGDECVTSRDGDAEGERDERERHANVRGADKDKDLDKDIKKPPAPGAGSGRPAAPSVVSFKNSPKHFRTRLERVMTRVKDACEDIQKLPAKKKPFNPFQAVQKAVNEGKHPDAILYALGVMADDWDKVGEPWGYWRGVLDKNSRNLWEKENTERAEGFKQAIADLARSPDLFAAIGLSVKSIPGSSRSSPGMAGG